MASDDDYEDEDFEDSDDAEEGDDFEEPDEAAEEESYEEPEEDEDYAADAGPRPAVSLLTILLCFLNVAATIGFAVLLVMDYGKRQEWSYAVFLRDLALMGLPLQQEADGPSASQQTMAAQRGDPDKLRDVYRKRGGAVNEPFAPVEEVFPNRIRPQHLSDEALKDHFKPLGIPVRTLEDEVERVRKALPQDIAAAAKETADKLQGLQLQPKRDALCAVLLPLARSPKQIMDLYDAIQKADVTKVDEMLLDACQRRTIYDIVAPLEFFRSSPVGEWPLENIADLSKNKLKDFFDMLDRRLKSSVAPQFDPAVHFGKEWEGKERDSIEKRQVIAFMLFTVAQARKPNGTPLYPDGPARVQKVIGLFEDAVAAGALAKATDRMTVHMVKLIEEDREGRAIVAAGKPVTNDGFVQSYTKEIEDLKAVIDVIKDRNYRLTDLQDQEKKQAALLAERQKHLAAVTIELIAERKTTAFELQQLRRLQQQLFDAQVKLADAHQNNLRLEQAIRRAESRLTGEAP